MKPPIPAVWRIDVEPNDVQHQNGGNAWSGFSAMMELVERLRPRLEDRSGAPVHPTWFLRLDPEIGRAFGRTDFVIEHFGPLFDRLQRHADPLGIHVHPYRWDAERQATCSEHVDLAWATHCLDVAAEAFERRFGERARRSSQGGYFLPEAVVDAAVGLGIEVDVTPEPGLWSKTTDASFGAYATGPSTDYRGYPRRPYYPSRRAAGVPARSADDARPILMVPLAAYDFRAALEPLHRRIADRFRGREREHIPLNPWRRWPSPHVYWNLAARAAEEQPARYLAFAIRSDAPETESARGARALMEGLFAHPMGRRIRFVDPLAPEIADLAIDPAYWRGPAPRAVAP